MIKASAPGKIILFGEHAVVHKNSKGEYNIGITAAIDKRSSVSVAPRKEGVKIISSGMQTERDERSIVELVKKMDKLHEEGSIEEIVKLSQSDFFLPSLFVIGKIFRKYGYTPIEVIIDSDVPKNLGSSSSVFSALALATLKYVGVEASLQMIADFANQGDNITHGKASGIDAHTSTYGAWNSYKKDEGVKRLDLEIDIPILVVDSGIKSRTNETVLKIIMMKKRFPDLVNKVLDALNKTSHEGLDALKENNTEKIGSLMTGYYKHLKKLGISTKELDKIVKMALGNGALGAKPTGGWNGGCCLVLTKDETHTGKLIQLYNRKGYETHKVKLGVEGVKLE